MCPRGLIKSVREPLFISQQRPTAQERVVKMLGEAGVLEGGAGVGGCAEHESIKSIQLRHEMQGSLSVSKPMKMTINQERVLWQR